MSKYLTYCILQVILVSRNLTKGGKNENKKIKNVEKLDSIRIF